MNVAEPERVATAGAERGLFHTLGVEPIAGRTFREDDPPNVVVIGEGFWLRRYAKDPVLLGSKIILDGESFTVIGVMPEKFQFPYRGSYTELWIPWQPPREFANNRGYRVDSAVARLKPGVTIEAARRELTMITKRLELQYPDSNKGKEPRLTPLAEVVTGHARSSLLTLLGAVGLVLLIACANVANLLLARAAARRQEVAIRAALGARRSSLMRQFLTESLVLATGGGLLGFVLAQWGTAWLIRLAASQIPRYLEIGFDWRVFLFLVAICAITGVGFGLAPALAGSRVDVNRDLRSGSGHGSSSRLRDGLAIAEIAFAFVLLTGAGLLLRAFLRLENTPTGLVTENVLTMQMTLPGTDYRSPAIAASYYRSIEESVSRIPGVRAAGFIQYLPLQTWGWSGWFSIAGHPAELNATQPRAELRYVTPGYFRAMGIPLVSGRVFNDRDTINAPRVILVNQALAARYFPGEDPVGKTTDRGTIIGVVRDVRHVGLDQAAVPELYYSIAQNPPVTSTSLVVSSQIPPETLAGAIRAAIRQVNPNQAIFNIKTMNRVVSDSLSNLDMYLWLIGAFAVLALLLAAAGIYGVMSYSVASRTREFGIRMAVGADSSRVVRLVLRQGVVLTLAGLGIGVAGAAALTRFLTSLLAGVTPTDPATFVVVSAFVLIISIVACLVPALRAMRVDPVVAMRCE